MQEKCCVVTVRKCRNGDQAKERKHTLLWLEDLT